MGPHTNFSIFCRFGFFLCTIRSGLRSSSEDRSSSKIPFLQDRYLNTEKKKKFIRMIIKKIRLNKNFQLEPLKHFNMEKLIFYSVIYLIFHFQKLKEEFLGMYLEK